MSTSDIVAIASLLIALGGMIFVLGKSMQRLDVIEKDLNHLGDAIRELDSRLDKQANFITRNSQQISYLEENVYGEDKVTRMRE